MTKEVAIKYLNEFIIFKKISNITEEEAVECFELAVEALQQPSNCEDEQIIRIKKGTLKARTGKYVIYDVEWLKTHLNQKTGHWEWIEQQLNKGKWVEYCYQNLSCSNCGYIAADTDIDEYKYCPNCGAKMQEDDE